MVSESSPFIKFWNEIKPKTNNQNSEAMVGQKKKELRSNNKGHKLTLKMFVISESNLLSILYSKKKLTG